MTPASTVVALYGLTIDSDLPLPSRAATGPIDLVVRAGTERHVGADLPPGRVIGSFAADGQRLSTITEVDTGFIYRVHSVADFEIDADLRTLRWCCGPDTPHEAVGLLLAASVPAMVLSLGGHLVLHASAVEIGGSAVAIVGGSGSGKTTLAALLCAGGARLISDDVVRIGLDPSPTVIGGGPELRLRTGAAHLVDLFDEQPGDRLTLDGRRAIRPSPAPDGQYPLGAVVVATPTRDASAVRVDRMAASEAALVLGRNPRSILSEDTDRVRRLFEACADVAAAVPVWRVVMPWSDSPTLDLAQQLVSQLGLEP